MSVDLQSIAKRKQKLFDRRTILFLAIAGVMFISLVLLIILKLPISRYMGQQDKASLYWTPEKQSQYANTLLSKGLKHEALRAYEKYMEMINSSPQERARVAYQIGNIYMDLGEYERALGFFYRVDMEDPNTELAPEIGQKIVACLERLGMTSQARYELRSRTVAGEQETESTGESLGPVIARIGKEEIRMNAINEALDQLPSWMQKQYESKERKLEFVRQYIANELLYRKAKRLGYENDPDIRVQLMDLTKQMLVQKVVMDEIGKITADPMDVKLYYEAHKDKYTEKSFSEVKEQVESDYKRERQEQAAQELLNRTLEEQEVKIYTESLE